MSGYDSWLEAPYTARANQELMWEAFEEQTGLDANHANAERWLEVWLEEGSVAAQQQAADDLEDEEE